MSVESIKGNVLEQLLGQAGCGGNGRTTLESFGFFLEKYVIQGAEITLDPRNPRRFTLSEAIISIDDGLYRVSTETLTLKGRGTTYFVDFTVKNGFVVNVQHPSGSFLALWEINTNATGNIVSVVDMRGEMGSIRFKDDMLGIITDQIVVDEQHILNQAVGTTKIKNDSVTTEKLADQIVTSDKMSPSYNASHLPYHGNVAGSNVHDALDNTKVRIDNIVSQSGDDITEIRDARQPENGPAFPVLGARLNGFDAQFAESIKQNNILTKTNDFKYFSHRGITAFHVENTILAFKRAADMGFYGVEMDVSKTLDGHFVIMHDETIDRTTTGTGKTSQLTLAQIKSFNIKDSLQPNQKVPTLEEALLACKKFGVVPILELKWMSFVSSEFSVIIDTIINTGMEYKAIVAITYQESVTSFRNLNQNIFMLWIRDINLIDLDYLKTKQNAGALITPSLTNYDIPISVVTEAEKNNIPILSFITESDKWLMDALDKNLTGTVTDNIRRLGW